MADHEQDFVARMIAKRAAKNSAFPEAMENARAQRAKARERAERRSRLGLTEAHVGIDALRVVPASKRYARAITGKALREDG